MTQTQMGVEKKRLSTQKQRILDLFLDGMCRVSNVEMSNIALKYSSRVDELRKDGYKIVVCERNYETGLVWYKLEV